MLDLMELYLLEDCPYEDETVELLKIDGNARLEILTREKGITACTEELAEFYKKKNICTLKYKRSGQEFKAGEVVFCAEGDAKTLFKLWRVSQTFLSITCAIATATKKLVDLAKSVNPNILVATTRKTHPGFRKYEIKAVISGSGCIHRNSLSDSILITPNHLNFVKIESKPNILRKVEIEPRTLEEALEFADKADVLLLDHYSIEELKEVIPRLKSINPNLKIAVAGNINEKNIKDYAVFADIIVTSSPYYAKPLDLTTKIIKSQ